MALPEGYAEKLIEKLRAEAKKSYDEKNEKIQAKYNEYKVKIEESLERAAKTFAEKVG